MIITVPFLPFWLTLFSGAIGWFILMKKQSQSQPALAPATIQK
jgi:hypothetical protein